MKKRSSGDVVTKHYLTIRNDVVSLLEQARRTSARAVNAVMTTAYWEIGRRIVLLEQKGGQSRSKYYGEEVIERLSEDLTARFGRGFGRSNLFQMRAFYLAFPDKVQTVPGQSSGSENGFPLPWSHYVRLLSVEDEAAREFYHREHACQGKPSPKGGRASSGGRDQGSFCSRVSGPLKQMDASKLQVVHPLLINLVPPGSARRTDCLTKRRQPLAF